MNRACQTPGRGASPRVLAVGDQLVWIDCEMTGLDLTHDVLIEVAALVTDGQLNVLGEGVDVVIKPSDAALEQMGIRILFASHDMLGSRDRFDAFAMLVAERLGRRLKPETEKEQRATTQLRAELLIDWAKLI